MQANRKQVSKKENEIEIEIENEIETETETETETNCSKREGAASAVCVGVTYTERFEIFICHSERSVESVSLCNIPPGSGRPMAAPTGHFVGASIARPLPGSKIAPG